MSDGMTDMARELAEKGMTDMARELELAEKGLSGSLGSQQGMETPNPPGDPWKHPAAHMRCVTCIWFVAKSLSSSLGRCRRHAPTMSGYPAVYTSDWCGDHKMDERAT